jgi:hypothetical protein
MSGPEVIIVHPDQDMITIVTTACEQAGLLVLGGAASFELAISMIASAANLRILLSEGNISPGITGGTEGDQLAMIARTKHPGVVVAPISQDPQWWSDFPQDTLSRPGLREIVKKAKTKTGF